MEVLRECKPIARKEYTCDACLWLTSDYWWRLEKGLFTFNELKEIVKAKQSNWNIQKGQRYRKLIIKDGGEFYVFKAIPAIDDICQKYDFYEE